MLMCTTKTPRMFGGCVKWKQERQDKSRVTEEDEEMGGERSIEGRGKGWGETRRMSL